MPEVRSVTTTPARPPTSRPSADFRRPRADGRPDFRRRVDTAGDALASLASAAGGPSDSDRLLERASTRRQRLATALRRVSEELSIERGRANALRREIRRLRGELASGRRAPSAN